MTGNTRSDRIQNQTIEQKMEIRPDIIDDIITNQLI